ncbi:hypothetical protein Cme02nite_00320 [Catellatospora methionotrophica]|uniref:YncI copper-binding domain-containing protein n=1 Tax=Catellatospora methionotrophica TaxID=121620 RepID=A0A8J3LFE1_9ACTN|nr:YcnI family protein [Catellatospora methionotrophica]GIG11700.1 hypothetical protein Cme02nite_00320 [Catellatospora methionotrophica]
MKTALRTAVVGLAAAAALALVAAPAAAHVTISPSTTAANAYTILTVSVPHGCDGSGTTKVSIKMPEKIIAVTPTVNSNWSVDKVMVDLNPPVKDSHGNEITKRVAEVVYTAKAPLPDGMRDAFELSLKLPDAAGETLVFPTVQTCEKGETPWVEVAASGQNPDELAHPAPAFKLTAATGGGHDAPAPSVSAAAADTHADDSSNSGGDTRSWIALILGALGLIAGGLALVRTRKTA